MNKHTIKTDKAYFCGLGASVQHLLRGPQNMPLSVFIVCLPGNFVGFIGET